MSETKHNEQEEGARSFLRWLTTTDPPIVLAYWNPRLNELMPIRYTEDNLLANYRDTKPVISRKVKAVD